MLTVSTRVDDMLKGIHLSDDHHKHFGKLLKLIPTTHLGVVLILPAAGSCE